LFWNCLDKLGDFVLHDILNSIERSLQDENWYSALVMSLIIPDILGKLEGEPKSSTRYPAWFDKYLGKKYGDFLSGKDCYALRCAYLHEGSENIETQNAKDILDRFVFVSHGPHLNRFNNSYFGDPKYDGKDFLQLSVRDFCQDMLEAAKRWLEDVSSNQEIQFNIKEMLTIREGGFSIGGFRIT
jgi:hypothetical protein